MGWKSIKQHCGQRGKHEWRCYWGRREQCLRHEGSQSCWSIEGVAGGVSFVYVLWFYWAEVASHGLSFETSWPLSSILLPPFQAQMEVQHEHIHNVPLLMHTVLHLWAPTAVFQVSCSGLDCVLYDGAVTSGGCEGVCVCIVTYYCIFMFIFYQRWVHTYRCSVHLYMLVYTPFVFSETGANKPTKENYLYP